MRNSNPNSESVNTEQQTEPETAEDFAAYAKSLMGDAPSTTRTKEPDSKSVSFQEQVNSLMKEVTVNEDGKVVYPDNTSESLKYAVAAEKKYRDTQSGFTKGQQSLKEVEAENRALREQLATNSRTALEIPEDKAEQLEELKFTDPEAWRLEMNTLEKDHSSKVHAGLKEQMSEVRKKAGSEHELARRHGVLDTFNASRNPDNKVTLEMLDNDIPPRITKKLADGHLTFEGFLAEVDEFYSTGRVVSNPTSGNGTSLNSGAGSHTPPAEGTQLEQGALDYSQMTF